MRLALPLRLRGDEILDAAGRQIALLRGEMAEYRANGAEIVSAVNAHADLLAGAKALLRFNEELCDDIGVSKHYPSAEKARAAIAKTEQV